jgi:hypothetical protein
MGFTGGILPTIGVLGWLCLGAALIALAALGTGRMQVRSHG